LTAPRIGITAVTRTVAGVERASVNAAYVRAVARAEGVPLLLTPLAGIAHNQELLDAIDGLVLTGGEDLHPAQYGHAAHPKLGTVDSARDAFELALFREAHARALPVLAICRGIQVVNVALGGTLWQDIPTERPGALDHNPGTGRETRTHAVHVAQGSRLAKALRTTQCEVNSFHHQSIRDLASGLKVSATAPDGMIEGVESAEGDPWLLAVQWHPEEFHHQAEAPDHGLFKALIDEAASAKGPRLRAGMAG
jgi:putative glutamine amidotransferase